MGAALPAAGQKSSAPVRFGVAWTQGAPQGEFAAVAARPAGFTSWVTLPLDQRLALGIRAEFSVLTFPEERRRIGTGTPVDFAVRSTIGFTGAGPRVEVRRGRLALAAGVMGGFIRLINDVSARAGAQQQLRTAGLSLSDYAWAAKASADLHWSVYRGRHGDGVGLVAGVDWGTGGKMPYPLRESLRVGGQGTVQVDDRVITPNLFAIRAGVGVEF